MIASFLSSSFWNAISWSMTPSVKGEPSFVGIGTME